MTLLHEILFKNWQRKTISIILSVIIWLVVNHSLTSVRTLTNIPVKVVNIPQGKTVRGLKESGYLAKKITLTLTGNQSVLDELAPNDLEVIMDARECDKDEWMVEIKKKNLVARNRAIDISKAVNHVTHPSFFIHMTKVMTEKIPVVVTHPVGQPPRSYDFIDVWPYQFQITVTGSEDAIKTLKTKIQKLTFDLSSITKDQLDAIKSQQDEENRDVVSFMVPDAWKQIIIPLVSDIPIQIDDPEAENLHIDFVHRSLQPIEKLIPISLFFPHDSLNIYNPETLKFAENELIHVENGQPFLRMSGLNAKGGSHRFVEMVKDNLKIELIASPVPEGKSLIWSMQFISPRSLENHYVEELLDASDDELQDVKPQLREEVLRNRFRSYMHHFQLFKSNDKPLCLEFFVEDGRIIAQEK